MVWRIKQGMEFFPVACTWLGATSTGVFDPQAAKSGSFQIRRVLSSDTDARDPAEAHQLIRKIEPWCPRSRATGGCQLVATANNAPYFNVTAHS